MKVAVRSDQGRLARNEDASLAQQESGLFLVCDGLGGKEGGDVASRMACDLLSAWVKKHSDLVARASVERTKETRLQVEEMIDAGIQEACKAIFQAASANPSFHNMCTTLDLLLLLGSHALLAHVGSGRAYLIREGEMHQLTEDHTHLAHLRRTGKLDSAPANTHASLAKRLTRAVGFRDEVKVDMLEVELEPSDRFLLVTDGTWLPLNESEMEKLCLTPGNTESLVASLHKEVERLDPRDNFTSLALDPEVPATAALEGSAEQKIKLLGKVPVFEFLAYQELLRVLNTAELFKVPAGKEVCKEGDPGGEMMLILSGSADVRKNGQPINRLSKGDVFGEMSMVDANPRSASVIATAPCNLLAFPREALFQLCREEPGLTVKLLWGVAMEMNKRLRKISSQLVGKSEGDSLSPSKIDQLPFHRSL